MTRAVFDIDFILFAAASVAEEQFITAKHLTTGKVMEFDNVTQLWGHHKKKEGGWIALQNELSGEVVYKPEEFEVTQCHRPRPFRVKGEDGKPDTFLSPLEGAKQYVTEKINAICSKLMVEGYFGYTGKGKVFRHDIATLLPYKGNREDMLTPFVLDELKQWAVDNHNIQWVEGIEADDAVSIATVEGYKKWKSNGKQDEDILIAVAVDKDSKATEGWHFNPNKDKTPRLVEGFGRLWLDDKGEPDGFGRIWLYWQILHGDSTDGYLANCFSDKKYAGKGAYIDLKDCKTDKEAFQVMVDKFKWMYPEKKTIKTFLGKIEIDAMYIFQEMANMAMMLRFDGDKIDVRKVCLKLGVKYD